MKGTTILKLIGLTALLASSGCVFAQPRAEPEELLVLKEIPAGDSGPPFYARLGLQFFHADGHLAVVFYRDPECVPEGFNLLGFYHFPSEAEPGAFGCNLTMEGYTLSEPTAEPGTFPRLVIAEGLGAVPVWFVPLAAFQEEAEDSVVTLHDLAALEPLIGSASYYHETLQPRSPGHQILAVAHGTL
jgi:hypothetical protein